MAQHHLLLTPYNCCQEIYLRSLTVLFNIPSQDNYVDFSCCDLCYSASCLDSFTTFHHSLKNSCYSISIILHISTNENIVYLFYLYAFNSKARH